MDDNSVTQQTATPTPPVEPSATPPSPAPAPAPAPTPAPAPAPTPTPTDPDPKEVPKDTPPSGQAPEEYADFTDSNGATFSAKEMPEFTAMAKELGLTQEKANKLLMTMVPTVKGKLTSTLNSARSTWKQAALTDAEYGGEQFKSNLSVANKAYEKFATPELKKLMLNSGLSGHPDFIRMFYRIGKSMSQDTGVAGQGSPQPKRRVFPNSNM